MRNFVLATAAIAVILLIALPKPNRGTADHATSAPSASGASPRSLDESPSRAPAPPARQPDRVVTRLVLLGCEGSPLAPFSGRRSVAEAARLADTVAAHLRRGDDPEALVLRYSDDPSRAATLGLRTLVNHGAVSPDRSATPRASIPWLGEAAFSLDVGEVAVVGYDESACDLGFAVIQRVE